MKKQNKEKLLKREKKQKVNITNTFESSSNYCSYFFKTQSQNTQTFTQSACSFVLCNYFPTLASPLCV